MTNDQLGSYYMAHNGHRCLYYIHRLWNTTSLSEGFASRIDPAGKIYVSWKIDETEAYTPTLAEARDEVIKAIQIKEARKLAREAAEAEKAQIALGHR